MTNLHAVEDPIETEKPAPKPPGRHYGLTDLICADFPDPGGYLGGNWFNPGTLSMVAGMPGAGKSLVTLLMAGRIATGEYLGPLVTKKGRVLYIEQEMGEPIMQKRAARLFSNEEMVKADHNLKFVFKPGLDLNRSDSRRALHEMVKQHQAKVVFLDCFTDIHRAEERDNQAMAGWMGLVRDRTAVELGCCVVFIHHFRKASQGQPDDIRGAQAIRAALSDLIYLVADNDVPGSGIMVASKVRDGQIRPPIRYTIRDADNALVIDFDEAA